MWQLYKFSNLIYLLLSSYIWFAFLLPLNYVPMTFSLLMLVCFTLGGFSIRLTTKTLLVFLLIVLYSLYSVFIIDVNYGIMTFFSYFPAVLLFVLKEEEQKDLLDFVTKWFCIIMGVSLFLFIVHFVIDMPNFPFKPSSLGDTYEPFKNYFFFMTTDMYFVQNGGIYRFGGPFLEPGHQSLICSLLLYANGFKMKEKPLLWILVGSVLLSFSLAGYLILAVGWLYLKLKNIYTMVISIVLLVGSWLGVTVIWNGGDNPINKLIIERLEFDNKKGIKGNNRTLAQTDHFYNKCVKDGTYLLGVRTLKAMGLKINGAGYKIFILRFGLFGVIWVTLIYLCLIPQGVDKKYALGFFMIIALVFLQRAYPSWYSWLLPYVLGLGVMRHGKEYIEEGSSPEYDGEPVDYLS